MSKTIQNNHTDVVILGGGLAGLSLACQLKQSTPDLTITVIEKNQFPVPEAVAKIGESTVEIGSYYLKDIIGLSEHFQQKHLKKFGLRCFFGESEVSNKNTGLDLSNMDELGTSKPFEIPTYQIDRGALENYLSEKVKSLGIRLIDGAMTQSVDITPEQKSVSYEAQGQTNTLSSQWLIDATGRQAIIKQELDLAKDNEHQSNALWFRVDRKIQIDDWSTDSQWHERCKLDGQRWLSTNHLMGPGYWIWIIPLASGVTSFGIVMDDQALADSGIVDQATTLSWLAKHHPLCSEAIAGADFMDFAMVRDYSYGCKQVFSHDGWALTGEAGLFTDPFYSPGSDFIAIGNSFINELIKQQHAGKNIALSSAIYNKLYQSFYDGTLAIYTKQYGGFGDRKMMGLKLVWDYAYYWGILSWLFFKGAMPNIQLMRSLNVQLEKSQALHTQVQMALQQRAQQRKVLPSKRVLMDQYELPCLNYFNKVLETHAQRDVTEQLTINIDMLEQIAEHLLSILDDETESDAISEQEYQLLGNYRHIVTGKEMLLEQQKKMAS